MYQSMFIFHGFLYVNIETNWPDRAVLSQRLDRGRGGISLWLSLSRV